MSAISIKRCHLADTTRTSNCSCVQCDSMTCFVRKHSNYECSCDRLQNECLNKDQKKSKHNDINLVCAVCLKSERSKQNDIKKSCAFCQNTATSELQELTENDINYETERKTLMETNQPPPHTLEEYLDRFVCANKASTKFKEEPYSLNRYIDIISGNFEHKKKVDLFNKYVQSLKETKPMNQFDVLTDSNIFMDSLSPQYIRLPEFPENHKGKSKCKLKPSDKPKTESQNNTKAQNAKNNNIEVIGQESCDTRKNTKNNNIEVIGQECCDSRKHTKNNNIEVFGQGYCDTRTQTKNNNIEVIGQECCDSRKHTKNNNIEVIGQQCSDTRNHTKNNNIEVIDQEYCDTRKHTKNNNIEVIGQEFYDTRKHTKNNNIEVFGQGCSDTRKHPKNNNIEVIGQECCDTRKTFVPPAKGSISYKFEIFKKIKEAYMACSCKVCECIPVKPMNEDKCLCEPCKCVQCRDHVPKLSTNLNCDCKPSIDQSNSMKQNECSCEPCKCLLCQDNKVASSDLSKPLVTHQREVKMHLPACTCLPCECSHCAKSNTALENFSDTQHKLMKENTCDLKSASLNEIYCQGDNNPDNIKQDLVALRTDISFISIHSCTQPQVCVCEECECIMCNCKNDAANNVKCTRFNSPTESTNLMKSNSDNNNYQICDGCNVKFVQPHHPTYKETKHCPCLRCAKCNSLGKSVVQPKAHLNRCRCTTCRCERCIGHGFSPNTMKKGDVLTPAEHQTKIQNLKGKETVEPAASLYHKKESLYVALNSNIKPQIGNMNNRNLCKNCYAKNVTSRPSVSRQAKRDMATMLTKSINRWNIMQCDAYVQAQDWSIGTPTMKIDRLSKTSKNFGSIYSIIGSSSKETINVTYTSEHNMKPIEISYHDLDRNHSDGVIRFPKSTLENLANVSNFLVQSDIKFTKSSYIPDIENTTSKKHAVLQSLSDFSTEIISVKVNKCENTDSLYNCVYIPAKDSDEIRRHKSNESLANVLSNSDFIAKRKMKPEYIYEPIKLPIGHAFPTKCLSASTLLPIEMLKMYNLEQTSNDASSQSSLNNGSNKCFYVLQNLRNMHLNSNIYNHYHSEREKIYNSLTNNDVLNDDNKRVRKTLEDAKKFSLHLLNLLKTYEKANDEFVKVSDKLKTTYKSVFDEKLSENSELCNNKLENIDKRDTKSHSNLRERITKLLTTPLDSFERLSHKPECSPFKAGTLNQESSNTDSNLLERVAKVNTENAKANSHKKFERIFYANIQKPVTPLHMALPSTNEIKTIGKVTHDADFNQGAENGEHKFENIEYISRSTSANKSVFSSTVNEETETDSSCIKISFFTKPYNRNKETQISGVPSEVERKGAIPLLKKTGNKRKNKVICDGNKVLNPLQLEVRKLFELAILEQLDHINNTECSLNEDMSSIFSDQDAFNVDSQSEPKTTTPMVQQPVYANKEKMCSNQNHLSEYKKQIREKLRTASYMHPLTNKPSSIDSSSTTDCDDLRARFLIVKKVSDHTVLIKWSQPRGAGVQGYELIVDGRIVQKILNPNKCITAVTCLPHTDKVLLTIRTITAVMPEAGHYPSSTIVYRPHLQ